MQSTGSSSADARDRSTQPGRRIAILCRATRNSLRVSRGSGKFAPGSRGSASTRSSIRSSSAARAWCIQKLYDWTIGAQRGFLWPHLVSTVGATLLGLIVAVVTGFFAGLGLSQNRALAAVFNPFIVALNSLPRIAMVLLITMIFGLGLASKVVTAWFIVFFLIFFNAFKGGVNIEPHLINFCRTLGGSNRQIMLTSADPELACLDLRRVAECGVVLADRRGNFGVCRLDYRHGLSDRHVSCDDELNRHVRHHHDAWYHRSRFGEHHRHGGAPAAALVARVPQELTLRMELSNG